jgi:hypothetical protein
MAIEIRKKTKMRASSSSGFLLSNSGRRNDRVFVVRPPAIKPSIAALARSSFLHGSPHRLNLAQVSGLFHLAAGKTPLRSSGLASVDVHIGNTPRAVVTNARVRPNRTRRGLNPLALIEHPPSLVVQVTSVTAKRRSGIDAAVSALFGREGSTRAATRLEFSRHSLIRVRRVRQVQSLAVRWTSIGIPERFADWRDNICLSCHGRYILATNALSLSLIVQLLHAITWLRTVITIQ